MTKFLPLLLAVFLVVAARADDSRGPNIVLIFVDDKIPGSGKNSLHFEGFCRLPSMPRALRIEYEDAIYHVMARGNQRRKIVFDDSDRQLFVDTLADACGRTEWKVYAWVLMSNHYHLVFRTPKANLVSGMTWFLNAFTRRMNASNKLWGRLFGDRYKAVLVDPENAPPAGRSSKFSGSVKNS